MTYVTYDWRTAVLTLDYVRKRQWNWSVKTAPAPVLEGDGIRATPFLASGTARSRRGAIRAAGKAVREQQATEHKQLYASHNAMKLRLDLAHGTFTVRADRLDEQEAKVKVA